jgi:hypothetical protein
MLCSSRRILSILTVQIILGWDSIPRRLAIIPMSRLVYIKDFRNSRHWRCDTTLAGSFPALSRELGNMLWMKVFPLLNAPWNTQRYRQLIGRGWTIPLIINAP